MKYKYTIQYNGALLSSFLHLSSEVHLNGGVDAKLGPIAEQLCAQGPYTSKLLHLLSSFAVLSVADPGFLAWGSRFFLGAPRYSPLIEKFPSISLKDIVQVGLLTIFEIMLFLVDQPYWSPLTAYRKQFQSDGIFRDEKFCSHRSSSGSISGLLRQMYSNVAHRHSSRC